MDAQTIALIAGLIILVASIIGIVGLMMTTVLNKKQVLITTFCVLSFLLIQSQAVLIVEHHNSENSNRLKRKKTKMKIVASSLLVAIGLCLLLHGLTTMALVKVVQAEHIAYISLASEDRFGSSVLVVSGTFLMIVGSILTIKATRKYLNR